MVQRTTSMRKITEIMRLSASGLSQRQIARSLNLSKGVVGKYIKRARHSGLEGPLPETLDEKTLRAISGALEEKESRKGYAPLDCGWIHQELKHKGVTLKLLHEEYKRQFPSGHYKYTQFCYYYQQWRSKQDLSLRQSHKAGEKLFIDYAGPRVPILDPLTAERREASIFIAVLGASNYTYVEATWDQTLPNWISSHVRAFEYIQGVPALLVPDNLKAGVHRACRYDPDVNPAYSEMAAHYGTAVMPARPYKPKDKAKVENAVLIVERWMLARLRHQVFYSLENLNQELKVLRKELNAAPFQKLPGSRASQFKAVDQPALKPLPLQPYVYAAFQRRRVGKDYHIELEQHFYSVPYTYAREEVDVRITAHTVEILAHGKRIASHERRREAGTTTLPLHQPDAHRKHQEWTPEACLKWAQEAGPHTHALLSSLFTFKPHSHQKYRLFLGFLQLKRYFGGQRLEAACQRALIQGLLSYQKVKTILQNGLDQQPLPLRLEEKDPIPHGNIRGATYYQ
jgi:transposase